MKFNKYNNPQKRRTAKRSCHSKKFIDEQREQMFLLLCSQKSEESKNAIIKAFSVSINP